MLDRDAAALARATRARLSLQERLVEMFRGHLAGGPAPSEGELRTFALLTAAEHRLRQQLEQRNQPQTAREWL